MLDVPLGHRPPSFSRQETSMAHQVGTASAIIKVVVVASAFAAIRANAQGCEPIRFVTPVTLGGEGQAYQPAHEWQFTLAYRRLASNQFFVGTQEASARAPGGQSPVFRIHTVVADVAYALNDRFRVSASLPVSKGSLGRIWPDGAFHEQRTTGIGDLSVAGEAWVLEPRQHERGNVALAVGVKAPTGSHSLASQFYAASGAVPFPADQTIQPGDGGWSLLLNTRAFRQLTERTHAYAFGSYMVSPKARSDVMSGPNSGIFWSVPDVYSAKLGAAYAVMPDQGLTLSLGGRIDGIPVRDLIGGGDDSSIKRTAYVIFADPGLSFSVGKSTLTLNVPYRVKVNREKSLQEQATNGLNGGGFAKYLVFAGITHRL
jgi:hypothetical protein